MDVTSDSVNEANLLAGHTAMRADGVHINGAYDINASYPEGISVVDTIDALGGTIRSIDGVDLSSDNVYAGALLAGYKAHNYKGEEIIGTLGSSSAHMTGDGQTGVYFYDYDGTLICSYSITDFANVTELPVTPIHERLVFQAWNWTLAQIRTQLTSCPQMPVNVGANYVTTSGATEIDVELNEDHLEPYLSFWIKGTVTIDWGDNTSPTDVTATGSIKATRHVYAQPGKYTISISSGEMRFNAANGSNENGSILQYNPTTQRHGGYCNAVVAIRCGTNCTKIQTHGCANSFRLKTISMSSAMTLDIDSGAFNSCYELKFVAVPYGAETINANCFYNCRGMRHASLPCSVIEITTSVYYGCERLETYTLPYSLTKIDSAMFQYCYSLESVIIPSTVTTVVSLNSFCRYDHNLRSFKVLCSPTATNGYLVQDCRSLESFEIPSSVIGISGTAFQNCFALRKITIPSGVTLVAQNAFSNCYTLIEYHFLPLTPPSLENTNAFNNINANCVIYVPYSEDHSILNAYKTATNWATYANYMQEEPH